MIFITLSRSPNNLEAITPQQVFGYLFFPTFPKTHVLPYSTHFILGFCYFQRVPLSPHSNTGGSKCYWLITKSFQDAGTMLAGKRVPAELWVYKHKSEPIDFSIPNQKGRPENLEVGEISHSDSKTWGSDRCLTVQGRAKKYTAG